jgi:hypothetical protein
MMLSRAALALALAAASAMEAGAAKITVIPNARLTCAVVRIKGDLKPGDFASFAKAILPLRRAIVELESEGGTIFDGVFIGKLIRGYGFWTTVRPRKTCASACALAWLGGSKRFIEKRGRIGFHTAYLKAKRKLKRNKEANDAVGLYMKELGLAESAVAYAIKAAPTSMTWLNVKDAGNVGMTVTFGAPPNVAVPILNGVPSQAAQGRATSDTPIRPDVSKVPAAALVGPLADREHLCDG